ncbi:MAG: hypothetical protein WDW36_003065 [Sanguina aurantia]
MQRSDVVSGRRDNDGLDSEDFRQQVYSQFKQTGVLGSVKSQLRAQLLSQLQKGHLVKLGPPAHDRPSLRRRVLNSLVAEYFGAANYSYSLSVFREEGGVEGTPMLEESEMLEVLKLESGSLLRAAYITAKARHRDQAVQASCTLLHLFEALSDSAARTHCPGSTQTLDRHGRPGAGLGPHAVTLDAGSRDMDARMRQVEESHAARARSQQLYPTQGAEERMALFRQEVEEQARAEIIRQVSRVREVELAAVRLDEASKGRVALDKERLELDRVHHERLAKLRAREEEVGERLRRQQRDVEDIAFGHRQKMMREEERLQAMRSESTSQMDARREQQRNTERVLEAREKAVGAREVAVETKAAQVAEIAAGAHGAARHEVEREYMELKGGLANQRMALEMDRARVVELRSEATSEIAAARAKEGRLQAQETARAEAETRAAAYGADAEICRLKVEKLSAELTHVRWELSRCLASASDSADAMLHSAAGAMGMLDAESTLARNAAGQLQGLRAELAVAREETALLEGRAQRLEQEVAALGYSSDVAGADARLCRRHLQQAEDLLDQAISSREAVLHQNEELKFTSSQAGRVVAELRQQLQAARDELLTLRAQHATQSLAQSGVSTLRLDQGGGQQQQQTPSLMTRGLDSGRSPARAAGAAGSTHSPARRSIPNEYMSSWGAAGGGVTLYDSPNRARTAAAPHSPQAERLAQLSRKEQSVAAELAKFRKRVVALQETAAQGVAVSVAALRPQTAQQQQWQQHAAMFPGVYADVAQQLLLNNFVTGMGDPQFQSRPHQPHQLQQLPPCGWGPGFQQPALTPAVASSSLAPGPPSEALLAALLGHTPILGSHPEPVQPAAPSQPDPTAWQANTQLQIQQLVLLQQQQQEQQQVQQRQQEQQQQQLEQEQQLQQYQQQQQQQRQHHGQDRSSEQSVPVHRQPSLPHSPTKEDSGLTRSISLSAPASAAHPAHQPSLDRQAQPSTFGSLPHTGNVARTSSSTAAWLTGQAQLSDTHPGPIPGLHSQSSLQLQLQQRELLQLEQQQQQQQQGDNRQQQLLEEQAQQQHQQLRESTVDASWTQPPAPPASVGSEPGPPAAQGSPFALHAPHPQGHAPAAVTRSAPASGPTPAASSGHEPTVTAVAGQSHVHTSRVPAQAVASGSGEVAGGGIDGGGAQSEFPPVLPYTDLPPLLLSHKSMSLTAHVSLAREQQQQQQQRQLQRQEGEEEEEARGGSTSQATGESLPSAMAPVRISPVAPVLSAYDAVEAKRLHQAKVKALIEQRATLLAAQEAGAEEIRREQQQLDTDEASSSFGASSSLGRHRDRRAAAGNQDEEEGSDDVYAAASRSFHNTALPQAQDAGDEGSGGSRTPNSFAHSSTRSHASSDPDKVGGTRRRLSAASQGGGAQDPWGVQGGREGRERRVSHSSPASSVGSVEGPAHGSGSGSGGVRAAGSGSGGGEVSSELPDYVIDDRSSSAGMGDEVKSMRSASGSGSVF